jgi:DNA-binding PadR family transcriptional regulator
MSCRASRWATLSDLVGTFPTRGRSSLLGRLEAGIDTAINFFNKIEEMKEPVELTTLEQHLLLAIVTLHPSAYGVSIQDHIKARTGREPSIGSIYASLDRLEEKGFVTSRQGGADR